MDTKLIEKFYSRIFRTPSEYVSLLVIHLILIISALNGFLFKYIFLSLTLFIFTFLSKRYLKLFFDIRRTLFFIALILTFVELLDIVVVQLDKELTYITPASMTALLTITLYFTSESSQITTTLAVFVLSLFFSLHSLISFIVSVCGIIIGNIYIKYLDKNFEYFNVRRFLKAFILTWLSNEPEYFEKELRKVGVKRRGWVKCLSIGKAKLISVSFHPGPMRNIGGAKLVGQILDRIDNSMFLHTAINHDLNPIDGNEVEKIVTSIKCDRTKLVAHMPYEIEGNKFKLKVFPFDKLKMIIVIGKVGCEDLPYELNEFAEKYGEVMLVEAHSFYKKDFKVNTEDVEEIKELIRKAFDITTEKTRLKYYFARRKVNTSNCDYVAILVLNYDNKNYAILMLDGNNVSNDLRIEIEKFGRRIGVDIIVISTDNHFKTGVIPKVGYKPVGANEDDRKAIFKFLEDVFKDLKFEECEISYNKNYVEVKVMGDKFFKLAELAFKNFGEKALFLFMLIIACQIIISLFLAYFFKKLII